MTVFSNLKSPKGSKLLKAIISCWIFLLPISSGFLSGEEFNVLDRHVGIQTLQSGYMIFPANRYDNAVYDSDRKMIQSVPGKMILNFKMLEGGEILNVKDQDVDGTESLMFIPTKNILFDFTENNRGQSLLSLGDQKILVRVVNNEIETLSIPFRSATGLKYNGKDAAAFYHIRNSSEQPDGSFLLSFAVHVIYQNSDKIQTVAVFNSLQTKVELNWNSDRELTYTAGDASETLQL